MTNFNTIVGLSSFSISNSATFSFYTTIDTSGIAISSDNPFKSFTFIFITIYSDYCDYKTPYYDAYSNQCWNICPGSSTADNSLLQCLCYVNYTFVNNSNCQSKSIGASNPSSSDVIIGVVAGVVVGIVVIVIVLCIWYHKCRTPSTTPSTNNEVNKVKKEILFSNLVKNDGFTKEFDMNISKDSFKKN
jgi:hypothetical protein